MFKCSKCKLEKPPEAFHKSPPGPTRKRPVTSWCRDCRNRPPKTLKTCRKCGKVGLALLEFAKNRNLCKPCWNRRKKNVIK